MYENLYKDRTKINTDRTKINTQKSKASKNDKFAAALQDSQTSKHAKTTKW